MELQYGLWNGVSALYSEGGRQLGEANTRPFHLNLHLPAETTPCKYAGKRNGQSINTSALRIAMQNFDAALHLTQSVKSNYLHRLTDLPASGRLGLWDLYILARVSISLIAYTKRRHGIPSPAANVSDVMASQYQFISGIFMIVRDMIEKAEPNVAENNMMSAEALYDYADENDVFGSFNGMVCAGSPRKIMEFMTLLTDVNELEEAKPQPDIDEIRALTGDTDRWFQYAVSAIELEAVATAEFFRRQPDRARDNHRVIEVYAQLSRYCVSHLGAASFPDTLPIEEGLLARQNNVLSLLGRPALKTIPEKVLTQRLAC